MNQIEQQTLKLLNQCEGYYAICNLMGRYSYSVLTKEPELFEKYWCKEAPNPSMGFNDGFYVGYEAIAGYYQAMHELDLLRARCIQKAYPELAEKTPQEIYGIGSLIEDSLSTPIVRIAGDGQTAKGLWYYMLTDTDLEASGHQTYHQWGWLAVDFVLEDGAWKIWHMITTSDFRFRAGGTWGVPDEALPALPEYAELEGFQLPEPNVKKTLFEKFHAKRRLVAYPPYPVPYETFADTFSYGAEEGGNL